jgi:hypothetical protein
VTIVVVDHLVFNRELLVSVETVSRDGDVLPTDLYDVTDLAVLDVPAVAVSVDVEEANLLTDGQFLGFHVTPPPSACRLRSR